MNTLKAVSLVVLLVGSLAFVTGCESSLNPVGPVASDLGLPRTLAAASVDHVEEKVPIGFLAFVPCANGGVGELVAVTDAQLHVIMRLVRDDRDGVHFSSHFQPIRNWDGIGQVTGDVYQATGMTGDNFNGVFGFPVVTSYVNNFRWIGPGPHNNLLVHQTMHVTINANGTVTADVDNTNIECR